MSRLPSWVRSQKGSGAAVRSVKRMLRAGGLHTVCESARCPNLGECFSRRTATFLILGDRCTRDCGFCAVPHGRPATPDPGEPERVAAAAVRLGLNHVVVTSVTRDDLDDGGSRQFVRTVRALHRLLPKATVEVLTPDFGGDPAAVRRVVAAGPQVFNHNMETVARLYGRVRPGADYGRSLEVLALARRAGPHIRTKSGIMVGLGETEAEVAALFRDLREAGCDVVTVGQYLQPARDRLPVAAHLGPERFAAYEAMAREAGFLEVQAGPLVRSSYRAEAFATAPGARG